MHPSKVQIPQLAHVCFRFRFSATVIKFVGWSTTNEHADSLSEIGTNSRPTKNSGSEMKHVGGKLLKK